MPAHSGLITRRHWMAGGLGAAAAASLALCGRSPLAPGPRGDSRVAILRAGSYRVDLVDRLFRAASACGLECKGKRVLIKPNLVEFAPGNVIHTDVAVLAAAVELCERLGALEVQIGEGPGHRRDTMCLAEQAGYRSGIQKFEARFTDLNRDDVRAAGPFAGLNQIYLPKTALAADIVISVARMKTHHWAGVTLSMKNLFGMVPGSLYGWPKNQLHRLGIDRSVAELNRIFPRTFSIVDGIVGMEGNGPIQGKPKALGVMVMGTDPVAVDATCCRLMGIDPTRIGYLRLASGRGHVLEARIEQIAERISTASSPFDLMPEFRHLRPT